MKTADFCYRLVQCHPDPFRCEPRNIGVFAYARDGRACFRLLGAGFAGDALYPYCQTAGLSEAEAWIFAEWEAWFRCLAEAGSFGEIERELSRLHVRGLHMGVTEPVWTGGHRTLEGLAEALFDESVCLPPQPSKSRFQAVLDSVLDEAGLAGFPPFHRDVEIELETPDEHTFIQFDGFLADPVPMGIKAIRFERTTDKNALAQVNDAIFTFGMATRHELLPSGRSVILYDRVSSRRQYLLQRIHGHGLMFQLGSRQTPGELKALAGIVA